MENLKRTLKYFLRKAPQTLRTLQENISVRTPWFDASIFFREFLWAFCVYVLVGRGLSIFMTFILYHTLSRNVKNVHRSEHPLATGLKFIISFTGRFILMLYISYLSFPSLVLHAYLRTLIDPDCEFLKYLDKGFDFDDWEHIPQATTTNRQYQWPSVGTISQEGRTRDYTTGIMHRIASREEADASSHPDISCDRDSMTFEKQQVAWINKVLTKLWPHIGAYIEDLLMYKVLEDLRIEIKDKSLTSGKIPPRMSSVRVREEPSGMFIDIAMLYDGDFSAYLTWMQMKFEIDHLLVATQIQIELKNLVGLPPFVGEVVIHMDQPPTIDVTLKKTASIFRPAKALLLQYIQDKIKAMFPLPTPILPDNV